MNGMDENPYKSPEERASAAPPEDWHFLRILFGLTITVLGLPVFLMSAAAGIVILLGEKAPAGVMAGSLACLAIGAASVWYGLRLVMRRRQVSTAN
jgi:hypothetical protein